ncbi:unnamed protein product, partial [Brassica oleracea]
MTLLEDCFSSAGYIMDIIKELAKVLKDDLTPRKKSTKLMIQTSSPDKQQRKRKKLHSQTLWARRTTVKHQTIAL